jgi:hypothetical protein
VIHTLKESTMTPPFGDERIIFHDPRRLPTPADLVGKLSILAHPIKLMAKHSIEYGLLITLLIQPSAAQIIQHGTYFVFGRSPDYVIVAIDSREVSGAVPDDRHCKIRPLSSDSFFFARGTTSGTFNQSHFRFFDAEDVATTVYHQSVTGRGFDSIADVWAKRVIDVYNKTPAKWATSAIENVMIEGFFVGIDRDGGIIISGQRITYQPFGPPWFSNTQQTALSDGLPKTNSYVWAAGHFEILDEFRNGGTTARAREAIKGDAGKTGIDAEAAL